VHQNPARAGTEIDACQKVDKHHQQRRRAAPFLNRALPACRLIPGSGLALEAVAAAALLIYGVWLAHDHLDSPILASARLPKNSGPLTEIQATIKS
jgi:hypothetical protein